MNQVHEDEATALIESLLNGLCDTSADNSSRDLCTRGVVEFFVWGIKQSTKKEMAKHPASIDSLMMKLFQLAAHPSRERRMSAVSIFGILYKHIREESALLNRYLLSILYVLSKTLRIESNMTTQQV